MQPNELQRRTQIKWFEKVFMAGNIFCCKASNEIQFFKQVFIGKAVVFLQQVVFQVYVSSRERSQQCTKQLARKKKLENMCKLENDCFGLLSALSGVPEWVKKVITLNV